MKKSILFGIIISVTFGLVGCQKDPKSEESSIITMPASAITGTSAVVGGKIDKTLATIEQKGICWSTKPTPTITDSVAYASEGGVGEFACQMNNLQDNKVYFVRAFAKNNTGVIYGEEISFSTAKKITVSTKVIMDVLGTCAMAGGKIDAGSDTTIVCKGICWSTESQPTTSDFVAYTEKNAENEYAVWLTNLTPSTMYFYRAYVTNAAGTFYGEERSFVTKDNPILKKTELGKVEFISGMYSVACVGEIIDTVEGLVIENCGFCWSKTPNPTVDSKKHEIDPVAIGQFKDTITVDVEEGVVYYVRSYVISKNGVAYGEENTFTTWTLPTISSFEPYSITTTSATVGGVITFDGSAPIISRGFCWTTEEGILPTTETDAKVDVASNNKIFYSKLSGLVPATTYYVRAYIQNEVGTAYSEVVSFSTKAE